MNAPRKNTSAQLRATGVQIDPRVAAAAATYHWATLLVVPAFVALVCFVALIDFDSFLDSLDEDHWVNWVSAGGWFLAAFAGVARAQRMIQLRPQVRAGLYFLAIFSLYVGLEEVNWGQRLTGMQSPEMIAKQVGHHELSFHNILTGLTGIQMDVLGGIILTMYGFALPLLLTAKPALRKRFSAYLICLPVPSLIPWFLLAGIMMATNVPGLSQEIGEMIFALCFALWSVCPPAVSAKYEPLKKGSVIAVILTIVLLTVPLAREAQSEHHAKRHSALIKGLSAIVAHGGDVELQALLDANAPLDPEVLHDPDPALMAFKRASLPLLQTLAKAGFNLDGYGSEGLTPVIAAIEAKNLEMVTYLLSLGASPNAPDKKGNSPLHAAILGGNLLIVDAVLQKNPDCEERDSEGYTPLMLATIHNFIGAVDRLLNRRVNLYEVDMTGRNVLELAIPGSESQVLLVAAVSRGATGGAPTAEPDPPKLEINGQPSLVWDTRNTTQLIHISLAIRNAGEEQANAIRVELFEADTRIGEMKGSAYILPGEIERYALTGKLTVNDRSRLRVEALCETCPGEIFKAQLLPAK